MAKLPEDGFSNLPHRSKKNTRRWCRGKPGVEHKLKCVTFEELHPRPKGCGPGLGEAWRVLVCTECGKKLELYYPMKPSEPAPPWVDR